MVVVQWGVPLALLAWFLWKSRTNRLFLLGIPVLMVMRGSVFFQEIRPFWMPGRFTPATHLMAWLALVWLVMIVSRRRGSQDAGPGVFGADRLLPEEIPLVLVAVLAGVHVAGVFSLTGDLRAAVEAATGSLYLLLGYLLVRGIASRATREETLEFFAGVVVANTVAAALYVAHQGLHLTIYQGQEYFSTVFAGSEITRTFTFMPQFSLLALGFVLAKREWSFKWLVVLAITLLSILVSYTRALLIAAVVGVVIAVVVREFSRPEAGRLVRRTVTIVVSVTVVVAAFSFTRPVEFQYLVERFADFSSAGGVSDIAHWQIRQEQFAAVQSFVARHDLLLGVGYPEAGSNPIDQFIFRWSSDSTWVPILYTFGLTGLVLFGALLIGFALRSLNLALSPPEERRYLGLICLITIALMMVMSFTRWTFTEPRIAPMGLWLFAFVAAEALRRASPEAGLSGTEVGEVDDGA